MSKKALPELLAPAGSREALVAAVAAGADAVYLGGKRFGARAMAPNFDDTAMKEAIDYAHLRDVKVYVTVNTLIHDSELRDVAEYLIDIYQMGADAVLVQDIGVASLARDLVPDLDLHASTQMTIHNREGALWAEEMGMKRVVLAREVSLDEVKEMAKDLKIGLEVFVHGALCYCYSGQCLLSSAIGGRSGNRGFCAQPCRKPYILLFGDVDDYGRPVNLQAAKLKERYLMSTRDLCLYQDLDKLVNAPIAALKIEGRMKSREYVAIVTSIYRRALDSIARGSWSPSPEDMRDLALAFNREFTRGYLMGSREVMGRDMPDKRGILVGTVVSFASGRGEATIRLKGSLAPEVGDGLVFLSPGQEMGMVVQARPALKDGLLWLRTPERTSPGAKVYLTGSEALSRKAEEIIRGHETKIPLKISIHWDDSTPVATVSLLGSSGPIEIQVKGKAMEKALKRPLTKEQIESQMRRTGATPFSLQKLDVDYPGDLFAPLGALNTFRREILERAQEALLQAKGPQKEPVDFARARLDSMEIEGPILRRIGRAPALAVYSDSLETVLGAVKGGANRVYFEPRLGFRGGDFGKEQAEGILQEIKEARRICGNGELVWKLPRITKDLYLKFVLPILPRAEVDAVMVDGVGAALAASETDPRLPIYGSSGLNVWNHRTVKRLSSIFQLLTLSPELSMHELSWLTARSAKDVNLELVVQGNQEVMVTQDCLLRLIKEKAAFWGLQDFRRVFPIHVDDASRTYIFNAVETCLVDHLPEILQMGLDGVAIDARHRTERYAEEMTRIYVDAIEIASKTDEAPDDQLNALKERARLISLGGITTGHFLKGLKEALE